MFTSSVEARPFPGPCNVPERKSTQLDEGRQTIVCGCDSWEAVRRVKAAARAKIFPQALAEQPGFVIWLNSGVETRQTEAGTSPVWEKKKSGVWLFLSHSEVFSHVTMSAFLPALTNTRPLFLLLYESVPPVMLFFLFFGTLVSSGL